MKKKGVKDRIIETASELFYQKGYNLTGINEIIEKAEVAKASMYSHFRSKEEICISYLQLKQGNFEGKLIDYLQKQPEGKHRILAIFDFLEDFFHQDNFRGCWCLNTISELPVENELVKSEVIKQKESFLNIIKKTVEENTSGLDEKSVNTISRRIYLLYEGAITESQVQGEVWPIREAKDLVSLLI